MTPFESGIAACTALTMPKPAAAKVTATKSFPPRDKDKGRFIAVSFRHHRLGARRTWQPQKAKRRTAPYHLVVYALNLLASTDSGRFQGTEVRILPAASPTRARPLSLGKIVLAAEGGSSPAPIRLPLPLVSVAGWTGPARAVEVPVPAVRPRARSCSRCHSLV